jgi:hypothetical protein
VNTYYILCSNTHTDNELETVSYRATKAGVASNYTRAQLVEILKSHRVEVENDDGTTTKVIPVDAETQHIRTVPNPTTLDNLPELPRCPALDFAQKIKEK